MLAAAGLTPRWRSPGWLPRVVTAASAMTRCDALVVGAGPAGSALAAGPGARRRARRPARGRPPPAAEGLRRVRQPADRRGARPDRAPAGGVAGEAIAADAGCGWCAGRTERDDHLRRSPRAANRVGPGPHAASTRGWPRTPRRAAPSSSRARAVVGLRTRGRRTASVVATARAATATAAGSSADLVVGADGVRSTVARLAGVERPVRFPRRLGLVAHYDGDPELDRSRRDARRAVATTSAWRRCPAAGSTSGWPSRWTARGTGARSASTAAIAGTPGGRDAARRAGAPDADPRGVADRPPGQRRGRAGLAAGRRRRRLRRPVHRRGDPPRAALGAGGRRRRSPPSDPASALPRASGAPPSPPSPTLSWLVQGFLAVPPLLEHALARLDERPAAALRLGSALGDCRPATDALAPRGAARGPRPVKKPRSTSSMRAPFERVFDLAADVERWPERPPALPIRAPPAGHRGSAASRWAPDAARSR